MKTKGDYKDKEKPITYPIDDVIKKIKGMPYDLTNTWWLKEKPMTYSIVDDVKKTKWLP